ncbi:MAG: DNA repair protein RecO [Lachnospiraceae bacterium]|nr:DNA repair protein RecO [Lachnospiraceae bacterium]
MQELVNVTAIVLNSSPIGEYDRRVVLLTKERGKITAFAKGARRQTSKLMAATNLFAFGEFKLYPGRNSYTMTDAQIQNYFEELRIDFEGAYYGMFFLEVCDYYTRENNDEKEFLKLVYQSLKALSVKSLNRKLVQCIFEMKAMVINGEFPGIPAEGNWQESTEYAVSYIMSSSIEKLYTFTVSETVLSELIRIAERYRYHYIDREFKSLEMLSVL